MAIMVFCHLYAPIQLWYKGKLVPPNYTKILILTSQHMDYMVRKISGRGTQTTFNHLMSNNILVTDLKDISNTLAKTFSFNSSTNHYTPEFQQHKKTQEKNALNFKSKNTETYNMPFSKTELQEAIKNSHDTSPGPDNIHYQFLRHLPEIISLQLLLHLLN